MADKPAADRTEQPTPKRLYRARSEGQVPSSAELPSALTLGAMLLTLYLTGAQLLGWFTSEMRQGFMCEHSMYTDPSAFVGFVNTKMTALMWAVAPLLIALTIAGVTGNLVTSGLNISSKALKLKLGTLNPISGMKQLFSARSLVQLLLSIVKLFFIGLIVYMYLRDKLDDLAAMRWAWSGQFISAMGQLIGGAVMRIIIAVMVIALIDVKFQKWKYIEELKMTKQEVKEERRQEDGSPEVKRRIRIVQFEMVRRRMMQKVPKANVVLVNPTHVAVAIQYDSREMDAPLVVAKGADVLAEKIKEIARAHGVPIIRRKELARTIYETVKVDEAIPEGLYVAVAEILAMIHRLRKRRQ
jgi:flagellar biosynthesis protein FlhB